MEYLDKIEVNPKIMLGKPVIKGTRITVEMILEDLSVGKSFDELIKSYPKLTKEGIMAACAFAADSLRGEKVYPIAV